MDHNDPRPGSALPRLTLVLGGAASGKSRHAEKLITDTGLRPVYIATAQPFDDEMRAKISRHREQRGPAWQTHEAPVDLAPALGACDANAAVLIDCATLWLTNLVLSEHDIDAASDALWSALGQTPASVVIVSNEVGQGIVPDNALSRRFRNAQGRLNQQIADRADRVDAVMAGLPLRLK